MLRSGTVIRLHELQVSGKSIREITRETGHSRNTIRKYLRAEGIPEPRPRKKRVSKLDPFKALLDLYLEKGIFNCEVLLRLLKERGYTGGHYDHQGLCEAPSTSKTGTCGATL